MTASTEIRVEGLGPVVRALRRLGINVEDLQALNTIADEGAQVASRVIPKRSGRLAGTASGSRRRGKAVVTVGSSSVPYAAPINYGWPARNIAPADFLEETDRVMEPRAVHLLEDDINHQIREQGFR